MTKVKLLGPMRCRTCSKRVWWDGSDWLEGRDRKHVCEGKDVAQTKA